MKETVDLRHGVNVIFKCDCGKIAEGKTTLERSFRTASGRSWGFGRVVDLNTIADITPDGWWAFDPYTYLCYCPECRALIEHPEIEQDETARMISWIDNSSFEALLLRQRTAAIGDSIFTGAVGAYYQKVLGEKRKAVGHAEAVRASKSIG